MAQVTPPGVPADFGNNPAPAGNYDLVVHDTNYMESKSSGHPMIHFKFKIAGPEYAGKFVDAYMLIPSDPSYEHFNMMWGKFNGMMESMGLPMGTAFPVPDYFGDRNNPQPVEFFHGKMCRAYLTATDGSDGYDPKNEVKNFKKPQQGQPSGVPGQPQQQGYQQPPQQPQYDQNGFPTNSESMDQPPF